MTDTSCKIIDV